MCYGESFINNLSKHIHGEIRKRCSGSCNPILYKRYVDDVFLRKRKEQDTLITKLNINHHKIRFTVEKNLTNLWWIYNKG